MLKDYLIVSTSVLPDYFVKVINVKSALEAHLYNSVLEACEAEGISRSTYYKYKDDVFKADERTETRKAVIALVLSHEPGTLSGVLNCFSSLEISILTISQSLPVNGQANVTISCDITDAIYDVTTLLNKIKEQAGVRSCRLEQIE